MKAAEEVPIGGGKYILGRKGGEGSFGQIFTGINKYNKKPVAIKLVNMTAN